MTLLAAWVLDKTTFGNWIFATGGNQAAAVRMGAPVNRVKILLYIAAAVSTTLVAALDIFAINQGTRTRPSDANSRWLRRRSSAARC